MLKRLFETKLKPLWCNIQRHFATGNRTALFSTLAIIIVSGAVIWGVWHDSQTEKTLTADKATALYAQAIDTLYATNNLYYRVDGTVSFSINSTVIEEKITQLITIESQGTDETKISVEEICQIGDFDIVKSSFYANENEFLSVQNAHFQTEIALEDYCKKFIPLVLLDPTLYKSVSGVATRDSATITFTEQSAVESWIGADITLINSGGTAQLDKDRALIFSTYTATYSKDEITFTVSYTAKLLETEFSPVQFPDPSAYTPLTNIDAPYQLERACAFLTCMRNVQTEYTDIITCEAFGDIRTQTIQMSFADAEDWTAQVDTTVSVSNNSKAGVTTSIKTECFSSGIFTLSTNGGEFTEIPDVEKSTMIDYSKDLLVGSIMMPQDISAVELTESDSHYTLNFQGNEQFASVLAEEACNTLYQSATILTDLAEQSETVTISGYISIDKTHGLPVASGFFYQGVYTISDLPYELSFKADQSYTFPQ